ncbi:MAG: hypothetical protein ACOX5I_00415 [Gleimia sp.]|nr:hypothetical protein [Acidobacteriota bacterium]
MIRDPRFIAGIALIIVSILLTTWIIQRSRGGEEVYQLLSPVAQGQPIEISKVSVVSAHTGSNAYLPVGEIPDGAIATRSLSAGELLPRDAVSTAAEQDRRQVVINVATKIPSSVGVGSQVEVWSIDASTPLQTEDTEPTLIAASAIILNISEPDTTMIERAQAVEISVTETDLTKVLAATGTTGALVIVPAG